MTHEGQGKIRGKFYPLQNGEWLRACKELKPAERDVLYYLRTLDPFGDSELELGVSALALALGRDKGTVSRALKALDQKGWIDLQMLKVKVKLHSRRRPASESSPPLEVVSTQPSCPHTTELSSHNQVVSTQPSCPHTTELSPHNSSCLHTTPVVSTQQSAAETQSGQGVSLSKTYKTFKDSLSDSEKREFLDFVRKQTKNFPQPINDLEAWLASKNRAGENRWEVYYSNFLSWREKKESATPQRSLHSEIQERRANLKKTLRNEKVKEGSQEVGEAK